MQAGGVAAQQQCSPVLPGSRDWSKAICSLLTSGKEFSKPRPPRTTGLFVWPLTLSPRPTAPCIVGHLQHHQGLNLGLQHLSDAFDEHVDLTLDEEQKFANLINYRGCYYGDDKSFQDTQQCQSILQHS